MKTLTLILSLFLSQAVMGQEVMFHYPGARKMYRQINQIRKAPILYSIKRMLPLPNVKKIGLKRLKWDEDLFNLASARVEEMALNHKLSHNTKYNQPFMECVGYSTKYRNNHVYLYMEDKSESRKGYGHRMSLMNENYTRIGVAVCYIGGAQYSCVILR